ncbi:hypothetical protein GCM10020000_86380 [Streptomyces olivoverticillatus]
MINPQAVIHGALGSYLKPGMRYHSPLPSDLEPWYCYTVDGGHSIAVAVDTGDLGEAPTRQQLEDHLCPAPVKSVIRAGVRWHDGFPVCTLPYDPQLGLTTPPEDDEYGTAAPSTPTTMHTCAVGELYNPKVTSWTDGHAELRLTDKGVEFVLFLASPAPHEVNAFRKGNAEFAVVPGDHHLMWCYRFVNPKTGNPQLQGPGIHWSDAPWEYHRQAKTVPVVVPGGRGATLPLYLLLVDSATGILQAQRLVGPPVEFADALRDAVERQASLPPNDAAATQEIQAVYARNRTTTDLLLNASGRFEALRD